MTSKRSHPVWSVRTKSGHPWHLKDPAPWSTRPKQNSWIQNKKGLPIWQSRFAYWQFNTFAEAWHFVAESTLFVVESSSFFAKARFFTRGITVFVCRITFFCRIMGFICRIMGVICRIRVYLPNHGLTGRPHKFGRRTIPHSVARALSLHGSRNLDEKAGGCWFGGSHFEIKPLVLCVSPNFISLRWQWSLSPCTTGQQECRLGRTLMDGEGGPVSDYWPWLEEKGEAVRVAEEVP